MDTTISIRNRSSIVDLSDIGDMIKDFCDEVEKLEDELVKAKARIEELEKELDSQE